MSTCIDGRAFLTTAAAGLDFGRTGFLTALRISVLDFSVLLCTAVAVLELRATALGRRRENPSILPPVFVAAGLDPGFTIVELATILPVLASKRFPFSSMIFDFGLIYDFLVFTLKSLFKKSFCLYLTCSRSVMQ